MRRVVLHEFGPYSNLAVEECADPVPAPDQALVAIEAAGIGFVDTLCVHGTYQALPALPWVPGCELAGTVVAIGDDVNRFAVGDRVLSTSFAASFQTHAVLRDDELAPVPGPLSSGQAAGLVASYGTMLYAFTCRMTLAPGEWVVVLGAGGGVGLAATDLATSMGARVLACASTPEKLELAVARRGRGHRRLLGSRARPEGCRSASTRAAVPTSPSTRSAVPAPRRCSAPWGSRAVSWSWASPAASSRTCRSTRCC